jgi:tetratricopeptide (TPR) repeat protein
MKNSRKIVLLLLCCGLVAPAVPLSAQQKNAVDLYREGQQAFVQGNLYRAIDTYKEALRLNEQYVKPVFGLAQIYFRLGEYRVAESYIRKARRLERENMDIAALEGRIYTGLGEFSAAEEVFERILRREPNNLEAQFGKAELQVARGNAREALDTYLQALRAHPRNKRGLLSAALLYENLEQPEEAEQLIRTAVQYYPNDTAAHTVAARYYMNRGRYESAERHASRALTLDPGNEQALMYLIRIYFESGRYEEAVPHIRETLKDNRSNYLLWYFLGKGLAEQGSTEEAVRAFQSALRLRPDDEVSRIVMEEYMLSAYDMDNTLRKDAASERFDSARGYVQDNRTGLARQEYRRGLKLAPYSVPGRTGYAETYKQSGDYGKYLSILEVVQQEGELSTELKDELEIYRSEAEESVSSDWGIDQFAIERFTYAIPVFTRSSSEMLHTNAAAELTDYFKGLLLGFENVRVPLTSVTDSFGEAYRQAREQEAHFFLLLSFEERERSFDAFAELYNGRTGELINSWSVYRTGNDKVTRVLYRLADDISTSLPLRGEIYRRDEEQVLLNVGRFNGLEPEDELAVIRRENIELTSSALRFDYNPDDILGTVTVQEVDELTAEGTLERRDIADYVNISDVVFRRQQEPSAEEGQAAEAEPERRSPAEIYQSLIDIR